MVRTDFFDAFRLFHIFEPFRAPILEVEKEAVLVNFETFAFELNFSHACPPWTS